MSAKHLARDICLFKGGHAHMQPGYWSWSQAMTGGSQSDIPLGFPPPAPPRRPQPFFSSLRFLAVTLTACVCGHLEKIYIPRETYIPCELLCGHIADFSFHLRLPGCKASEMCKLCRIHELNMVISGSGWSTAVEMYGLLLQNMAEFIRNKVLHSSLQVVV